ncbi:MAG: beta-propeller domain-containing protein [Clostridia bacterium]|nr:beta-propeller domain-containing protein [Clostridia bacterium]
MKSEDMNVNEVLSEKELSELNDVLKACENAELPEGLSKENIVQLLKKEVNKEELLKKESEDIRKENKSLFKKMIAAAAVFAIVVTSLVVFKPWQSNTNLIAPSKENTENTENISSDYAEIENLFVSYKSNYQKSQRGGLFDGIYGAISDFGAMKDSATMEGGLAYGAPVGGTGEMNGSTSGAVIQQSSGQNNFELREDTLYEDVAENTEHGETNEQVKGVNEADIIKNDGKYLYVVPSQESYWTYIEFLRYKTTEETTADAEKKTDEDVYVSPGYNPYGDVMKDKTDEDFDNKICIVSTDENGKLKKLSDIKFDDKKNEKIIYSEAREIFVDNDRLVVIADCYSAYADENAADREDYYVNAKHITSVISYDIKDRSNPKEEWRVYQDGLYISARKINNKLAIVSKYHVPLYFDNLDITDYCVPEVYKGYDACRIAPENICMMDDIRDSAYVVASTIDVTDCEKTFNSVAVLGGGQDVYCDSDTLYVTSGGYESTITYGNGELTGEIFMIDDSALYNTEILKFDISGSEIKYVTKGKVNGHVLNQFSMDEYNGYLRVATTTGSFAEAENNLYILNENLEVVGKTEGIAKGETIKSVRFMGDTGYVVTFEQTDPLFVIDLKNPKEPKVLGELKIPGFSKYLHPVSDTLLLGIGVNGDEGGSGNGMKVSLFDVSDSKNPKEISKYEILPPADTETDFHYIDSVALNDHKAVCWDSADLVMYIPYIVNFEHSYTSEEGYNIAFSSSDNVIALKIDVKNKKIKKLNNYQAGYSDEVYKVEMVNRVTYTGDVVYSYSQGGNEICSFNKQTGEKLSSVNLNK